MVPRRSYRLARKKYRNGQLPPNSEFYPIASDATVARLRGCTIVQTELPRMMQGAHNSLFAFKASFISSHHLYAFFNKSENLPLQLARLCLFSQTWQVVPSFSRDIYALQSLLILPLPWVANNRQVLLFYDHHCTLLTLKPPKTVAGPPETTLNEIDLHSMLSLSAGDNVDNEEWRVAVEWHLVVADQQNQAVYALARVALSGQPPTDWEFYRLDWASRLWSRLTLVHAAPLPPIFGRTFMALYQEFLYIGIVEVSHVMPNRRLRTAYSLTEVIRINLNTLVIDRRPVTGRPDLTILNRQDSLNFCPVGDTVYTMNALLYHQVETIEKNQLWALDLPSLVMMQINDGPQGKCPRLSTLMFHSTFAATADGSELWALSKCSFYSSRSPRICLHRTLLKELPSLASMTLDCLLLRRPMAALMAQIEGANTRRPRRIPKQRRTLTYLRSVIENTPELQTFPVHYLPEDERWEEEMPQQQQQPN